MSTWHNHNKRNQHSFRKFMLIVLGSGVFIVLGLLGLGVTFLISADPIAEEPPLNNEISGPITGNAVLTREPTPMSSQGSGPLSGSAAYLPQSVTGAMLPDEKFINQISTDSESNTLPKLHHSNEPQKAGPLQVEYTISSNGRTHSHSVGRATTTATDIVGAAAEWQVRPWWRPGWVHQTVDCGEEGTAAIGGHVSWGSKPGPFYDLGAMAEGDIIRCLSSDKLWYRYRVTEVVRIDYNETNFYWQSRPDLHAKQLTLFSCTPEITGIIVVRAELYTDVASADQ